MIGLILASVIWAYLVILTVRGLISFIPLFVRDWQPRGFVLIVAEVVFTLTDPPLRFIRRFVKPINVGGMSLDVAFVVLYVVLSIAQRIVIAVL